MCVLYNYNNCRLTKMPKTTPKYIIQSPPHPLHSQTIYRKLEVNFVSSTIVYSLNYRTHTFLICLLSCACVCVCVKENAHKSVITEDGKIIIFTIENVSAFVKHGSSHNENTIQFISLIRACLHRFIFSRTLNNICINHLHVIG